MNNKKTFYYSDELNDEFSGVSRLKKEIPDNYKYINNNLLWKFAKFIVYEIVMKPVAFLYCKIKFSIKIENRQILSQYKSKGYFLYGNHTQIPGDGYIPNLVAFPKDCYEIVNSDNVALKGTEQFMLMIGAMPIPTGLHGVKNFTNALGQRIEKGNCVTIYPEAHIWPYYTKIRPYKSVSFQYPIKFDVPSFSFTVTYQKRKHRKTPKITVFVDGPFFPDKSLSPKKQRDDLRNQVYNAQVERSNSSNYCYIEYKKSSIGETND